MIDFAHLAKYIGKEWLKNQNRKHKNREDIYKVISNRNQI